MLGWFWSGCIVLSFFACLIQLVWFGQTDIFDLAINALFDTATLSVEISIGLIGLMAVWLGFFRIAEHAGLVDLLSKALSPLFKVLMPEVPRNHPALAAITMNLGANGLGLDNAATPLGIKAMRDLQLLNPIKNTLSNAQILFLVLNTSSVTVLPVSVFLFRAQQGAAHPSEVFVPIIIATFASTIVGLLTVAYIQRLRIFEPIALAYLAAISSVPIGLSLYFINLPQALVSTHAQLFANVALFSIVTLFLVMGWYRQVRVYESFVQGAKLGFATAIKLIPYLIAMLLAIALLRASGILGFLLEGLRILFSWLQFDTRFIDALPTALMKPFSGSGARAAMLETMQTHGVDSFAAKVAAVMQGSTETTFYVLAVYCGAVGITRIRYALPCALLADAAGITAAILISYVFFA